MLQNKRSMPSTPQPHSQLREHWTSDVSFEIVFYQVSKASGCKCLCLQGTTVLNLHTSHPRPWHRQACPWNNLLSSRALQMCCLEYLLMSKPGFSRSPLKLRVSVRGNNLSLSSREGNLVNLKLSSLAWFFSYSLHHTKLSSSSRHPILRHHMQLIWF